MRTSPQPSEPCLFGMKLTEDHEYIGEHGSAGIYLLISLVGDDSGGIPIWNQVL